MRLTATAVLAALLPFTIAHAQEPQASANMIDREGRDVGTVTFTETASGVVHIMVEMNDLPPGPHGFHIHEAGECNPEDGFDSAGGHYAGGREHGIHAEGGPHPGDLPNVHVVQSGVLKVEFFAPDLSLSEDGENPLLGGDGTSVVVHASPDDYTSQPSGDAGDRIACGVITSS
jgi:superoxide dismutase, Cu-Zn family